MGFIGSIGKALGGVIKQVAPSLIKAIAPAASKLLGGIAGDIFQKGAGFLKGALSASSLPAPLKALGEKLLGKGFEKLNQFAQGGIDKLLQKVGDMITKRFAPGVGDISLPGTNTPGRQAGIQNNAPGAPGGTGSSSGAASGTGSSSAAASGSSAGASGSSRGANLPPEPLSGADSKDVGKQNEYNSKMFDYQQAMSNMNKFWEMMSTVQKSHDQTRGSMIQNLR